ncbi:hypothetical protein [Novispirillum itersonii]|uniref:RimJ/RimL family protein N-acetyltransferase n=1 Tax=Novispirillum itersonii TaxID=189 RepID=A0A7W9ZF25_NOVIT|nr:hypothetical protein [Novispirillum itersonii]MBB6210322.1 RimJ/RimL family protein N-acetyltransferase [Novispirillum itersonii]
MPQTAPDFALRPEDPSDLESLRGLYIVSRWQEMAEAGLPEAERPEFLTWQFFQQRDHFAATGAEVWVITVEGAVAGRLVVQEQPGVLALLGLAVLPPWQGGGLEGAVRALAAQRAQEDGLVLVAAEPAGAGPATP